MLNMIADAHLSLVERVSKFIDLVQPLLLFLPSGGPPAQKGSVARSRYEPLSFDWISLNFMEVGLALVYGSFWVVVCQGLQR